MTDWTVDELKTARGKSHFAEFVASLTDRIDIKDTAVLIAALRVLGNRIREPRSKSLGGYEKKRTDTPPEVLRLMRARLKEAHDEYEKSRTGAIAKKSR